jgi:hypothetical protein
MYLDLLLKGRELMRRVSRQEEPVHGRTLKAVAELPSPTVFSAAADRIGLLGPRIAASLTEFYATNEQLNSGVRVLAIDPAAAVDKSYLERLVGLFDQACRRALPLLAKLPHEKSDAALKATIESFASQAGG